MVASRTAHDELQESVMALFDRLQPDLVAIRKGLWELLVRRSSPLPGRQIH